MRRSHKVDILQTLLEDKPAKPTLVQSLLAHPNGINGEEIEAENQQSTTLLLSVLRHPNAINGEEDEASVFLSEISYTTDEELDVDVSIDDGTDEPISQREQNRLQNEAIRQMKKIAISKSAPIAIPTPKTTPAPDADLRGFSIFTAARKLMEEDALAALTNKKVESAKRK